MYHFFVGIDPSLTGTGLIVLDRKCVIHEKKLIKTTPDISIEERIGKVMDEITFVTGIINRQLVYIEGLSFASKGSSMFQLAGLHYYIRTRFYISGTGFSVIPPTTLKKWVTGKGNAKKEIMILECYKKFGESFDDNNLCDAYCLARMALADHEEETNVKE